MKYVISYDVHDNEEERSRLDEMFGQGAENVGVSTTFIYESDDNEKFDFKGFYEYLSKQFPSTDFFIAEIGNYYNKKQKELSVIKAVDIIKNAMRRR